MKNRFFLFALIITTECFAQKEANIWYFGAQAGVDFNSGTPVALTNCSPSFAGFEGVGTLSDSTGKLIFYTDGFTIFNANHVAMPNGTGLISDASSTQTGLSIKQPGSSTLYYVFHLDLVSTVYRSIVDMSLNGGLGDVTSKNVLIRTNTTEKVTAVNHANGHDVWILTRDNNSNVFAAYLLSSAGLSSIPVISNVGPTYTSSIGYLKASPQGNKLASADFFMNTYSIYDFDNATGVVSNASYSPANYTYAYGCEWSPDGTKLYGGRELSNELWQFDVSAGSNVWNAKTLIVQTASSEFEALQLGPDGKIYCSRYSTPWLGVINKPDSLGLACSYVDNGVDLLGRACYLGLPNYNMSIFVAPSQPQPAWSASDTIVCEKFCVNFYDSSPGNPTSWLWKFEGGNPATSTAQNPFNICYDTPGDYDVTLIVTNASGTDSTTLTNYIKVSSTPPAPSISVNGNVLTCSSAPFYQWQFNTVDIPGATNQTYTATQSGLYTVIVSNENGCLNQTSAKVSLTAVNEISTDRNLEIFPNPSNGNFNIQYSSEAGEFSIVVLNALGQEVYFSEEKSFSSSFKKEISLSDIPDGVYFVELRMTNAFARKKILIAH